MICLHRLRGDELWVNPDLIVFAEHTGRDTVVTLADGNRVTVCEPAEEIASTVMQFRASVLAAAENVGTERDTDKRALHRAGYDSWDLSVDRAVSVVMLLGDDETSYTCNRRAHD